jgi:N-acetyl sugar amidotransferase
MRIRYCTRCVFPETKPDLSFNDAGVCSACATADAKANGINWEARGQEFYRIIERNKKSTATAGYDCVIPVSGGKDSTFQTWFMKEKCGMNPLCVCFETTLATDLGKRNLDNISRMGVDVIHFKKNHEVYRQMVIESFIRVGDEMWPNHIGIFTVPVIVAVKFGIPLIIWGENPQMEYGSPDEYEQMPLLDRRWLEEYGGLLGNRIQDMIGVRGLTERDLTPYFYPTDEEIKQVGLRGLFLGYYFFWDARNQLEIIKQHGFSVKEDGPVEGTYTNFENLDEKMHGLHDYLKFVKYGFGRATDHACIDIRNKRLTRDEAVRLVYTYDGKYPHESIAAFVNYSGLSKEEIDRVIDSFTNPTLFEQDGNGVYSRDADGNLKRRFSII